MYIEYATRSNDGVISQHPSLEQALEFFLADDGYRLDFIFPDGRVMYIHRAEYGDGIDEESGFDHPTFANYSIALAKVLYYHPNTKTRDNDSDDNVLYVKFGD
jgi:hypothetical protein